MAFVSVPPGLQVPALTSLGDGLFAWTCKMKKKQKTFPPQVAYCVSFPTTETSREAQQNGQPPWGEVLLTEGALWF